MAATVLVLIFGNCRPSNPPETQPAPNVTTFEEGTFDNLPLVPRSQPFGARSETAGVITRTYRATGVTPDGVIAFYERALPPHGWQAAESSQRTDTSWRADWVTSAWRLEVTSVPVPDRDNPAATETVVQYSLVLRPR